MLKVNKEKINGWLELKNWSQRDFAKALDYDESVLSRVINGEEEASKQLMKKLMLLTGLDLELFQFDRSGEK